MTSFYAPEENGSDDFEDENFGLGEIHVDLIDSAADILFFLEAIDWKWDINTLLQQPADLFHAVMSLKYAGYKLGRQARKND